MPRYQVEFEDPSGQRFAQAVEAPDPGMAAALLGDQGHQVHRVDEVPPGFVPRAGLGPAARAALAGSLLLAAVGLILAAVAVGHRGKPRGLGSGIEAYDFSSPEAGLKSIFRIRARHDWLAARTFGRKVDLHHHQERYRTLSIRQRATYGKAVVLFVRYEKAGAKVRLCVVMRKHPASGLWQETTLTSLDVEKVDPELARRMRRWRDDGKL